MTIRTNLSERLRDGRKLARKDHLEKDAKKLGNLRAGNTGMMAASGDCAGACPRTTHLRQLGFEVEVPDDSKVIMFQMGTANEVVVYKDLIQTVAENEIILQEEEIPIEWFTSNGTKVSGRPDMVICERGPDVLTAAEGEDLVRPVHKPIWGIEIKSIASVWTTRDVLFQEQPKLPHLLQSAHYSWKLDVPFKLLYKQYTNQAVPGWAGKLFPKQGERHSEHIEYNEKGDIKNVKPFEIVYELDFDSSSQKCIRYRRETCEGAPDFEWKKTLVSQADIERFYEFVSKMSSSKELGKRPMTIDANGVEKNYSNCNYCPLKDTCDKYESKGYDVWLDQVTKQLK